MRSYLLFGNSPHSTWSKKYERGHKLIENIKINQFSTNAYIATLPAWDQRVAMHIAEVAVLKLHFFRGSRDYAVVHNQYISCNKIEPRNIKIVTAYTYNQLRKLPVSIFLLARR
jgi:hypothetical protein